MDVIGELAGSFRFVLPKEISRGMGSFQETLSPSVHGFQGLGEGQILGRSVALSMASAAVA